MHDETQKREAMVREQIEGRGIRDPRLLEAMRKVPRHCFVPAGVRDEAYDDHPLAIGEEQTISQPYVVALMIEAAALPDGPRVLEVGAGSGYAAAILAEMGATVFSVDIRPRLVELAQTNLQKAGISGVCLACKDGFFGWREAAPFDAILVAAAAPQIPPSLLEQLALGGRLLIPVGSGREQRLQRITRTAEGDICDLSLPVRFVPMIGEVQTPR